MKKYLFSSLSLSLSRSPLSPTRSKFVELNEFLLLFFLNVRAFINERTGHIGRASEGKKWVGDEIDATTDNILSTLFVPPGERVSVEREITNERTNERTSEAGRSERTNGR